MPLIILTRIHVLGIPVLPNVCVSFHRNLPRCRFFWPSLERKPYFHVTLKANITQCHKNKNSEEMIM